MTTKQDKKDIIKYNLLKALELSMGNVAEACKKAKVARNTYYVYYNSDLDFKKAVDDLEETMLDFVESKMRERIKGYTHRETKVFVYKGEIITKEVTKHYPPDSGLITFYLETKGQKRGYVRKQIIENTTGNPFDGLNEQEIDELLKDIKAEEKAEAEKMKEFRKLERPLKKQNE